METSGTRTDISPPPRAPQRSVRLRRATIRADRAGLHRTAEFTDGSTRNIAIDWRAVRRVAAFRRDVLTTPVLCVAITDPGNVVVLDESMEGWRSLLEALPLHLQKFPNFADWHSRIGPGSTDSYWTILFKAQS